MYRYPYEVCGRGQYTTLSVLRSTCIGSRHTANAFVQPFGTSAETTQMSYKRRYSLLSAVVITFNCLADYLVSLVEILR